MDTQQEIMNNLTPLQIAIYAINCPIGNDEYVDEVAKMIERYAISKALKEHSPVDDWKAPNKRYYYLKELLEKL